MVLSRLSTNDPRTIARDIPGLTDALFPHLAQGVVASFNRRWVSLPDCEVFEPEQISISSLQKAMLFELAVAAAEQLIAGSEIVDWDACLGLAVARQKRHYDAQLPSGLTVEDKTVALRVATNLVTMLRYVQSEAKQGGINCAPEIPGYQWIASGAGDFSVGSWLIEVKCTRRHFSASDYRQIMMYWLLSYAAALEGVGGEFTEGVLLNPRLNRIVRLSFKGLVNVLGGGRSKVELLEVFASMVADRSQLMMGRRTRAAGALTVEGS